MPRCPHDCRPAVETLEGRALLAVRPLAARAGFPDLAEIAFQDPLIVASQQADAVAVTLTRALTEGPAEVRVTTAPSAAIGVNLPALDQTVTFADGQSEASLLVPIIPNAPNAGAIDVSLQLKPISATAGLTLGAPADLRIVAREDVTPPTIVSSLLTRQGIELTFSEPMDRATVEDIRNYIVSSTSSHKSTSGDLFGYLFKGPGQWSKRPSTQAVPIRSATYDPATQTVTLRPARSVNPASVTVVRSPQPRALPARFKPVTPLTDAAGNLIDMDQGPGQFRVTVSPVLRGRS